MPTQPKHQLAAIMFTDIVGYTVLMGKDERKALKLVRKNLVLQKKLVRKHGGKWLKEMGDGIIASFPSASDAVRCAGEIQMQLKNEEYQLRIGIHLGEVIFDNRDIYGDGVNIASRIEAEADIGGICISHDVYRNVKNKPGIQTKFIEEKKLKNVEDPIKLYRVDVQSVSFEDLGKKYSKPLNKTSILIGSFVVLILLATILLYFFNRYDYAQAFDSKLVEKSIAVLPFKNDSEEKEASQHICDGIMEAVLDHLSKLDDFRLVSRQSVEQYRGSKKAIPKIAEELNVSFIIEGSVRRYDDQLRIYAQLLDAQKDKHLWSQSFDGEKEDIFLFESRIAKIIADNLNAEITTEDIERIEKIPTSNLTAYDLFLRGKENYVRFQFTHEERHLNNALKYYEEALRVDPGFGQVYAFKAKALWDGFFNSNVFTQEIIDTVFALCNKALSLEPTLAEAYFLRGRCYLEKSQFRLYKKDIEKALKLNPSHAEAHVLLGHSSFVIESNHEKGLRLLKRAEKLDRGEGLPGIYEYLGWLYLDIGSFRKSEYYAKKAIELRHWGQALFWTYTHQGKFEEALNEANRLYSLYPEEEYTLWYNSVINMYLRDLSKSQFFFDKLLEKFKGQDRDHELNKYRNRLGYVYWQKGKKEQALKEFNKSMEYLKEGNRLQRYLYRDNAAYNLAATNSFLGNKKEAYKWLHELEKYGWHWGYPFHIERDPLFDNLRDDKEFRQMVLGAQNEKTRIREKIHRLEAEGEF